MLSEINQGKGWQFPAVNYLDKFRDRPRFFDQVGHQTTYACIGNLDEVITTDCVSIDAKYR